MNVALNYGFHSVITDNIDSIKNADSSYTGNVGQLRGLKNHLLYFQVPSEVLGLVVWSVIFWMGTRFEQLYSKRNYMVISIAGFISLATHAGLIYEIY